MKPRTILSNISLPIAILGLAILPAISQETPGADKPVKQQSEVDKPKELIAVLMPTKGNEVTATIVFTSTGDGKVLVRGNVRGLKPHSAHGIHIHQFGDASSQDGTSAGDHFNPAGHPHALPDKPERHAGDLGNLKANEKGEATIELTVENLKLEGEEGILGRSVIIHEKEDTGAQPSGDAGDRIAQGVIGIRQPSEKLVENSR